LRHAILLLGLAVLATQAFGEPPAPRKAKPSPLQKVKTPRIPAIESFFLPYPDGYSIPEEMQKSIAAIVQGQALPEQRWRDLYQDKGRVRAYLGQLIRERIEELGGSAAGVKAKKEACWKEVLGWQRSVPPHEAAIESIRYEDYGSVQTAINGLLASRQNMINIKQQLQKNVDQLQALQTAYGGLMNNQQKRDNNEAQIRGLQTIESILQSLPVLDAKVKILRELLALQASQEKSEGPMAVYQRAEKNLAEWGAE
jgi:hypothetical protein